MEIIVNEKKCPQNHKCPAIRFCPVQAITQEGFKLPKIDMNKCIKCEKCVKVCPMRAFEIKE